MPVKKKPVSIRNEVSGRFNEVNKRFDEVNERFDEVNERFDVVNEQFDAVNERFDVVNEQFKRVDSEASAFRADVNQRFDKVDDQFRGIRVLIENLDKKFTDALMPSEMLTEHELKLKNHSERLEKVEIQVRVLSKAAKL